MMMSVLIKERSGISMVREDSRLSSPAGVWGQPGTTSKGGLAFGWWGPSVVLSSWWAVRMWPPAIWDFWVFPLPVLMLTLMVWSFLQNIPQGGLMGTMLPESHRFITVGNFIFNHHVPKYKMFDSHTFSLKGQNYPSTLPLKILKAT